MMVWVIVGIAVAWLVIGLVVAWLFGRFERAMR